MLPDAAMIQQYVDAAKRYGARRAAACEATQIKMNNKAASGEAPAEFFNFDLTPITGHALADAAGWVLPWEKIYGQARPYLRRLDVACWHEGALHGLMVGRSSKGHSQVCIHYLERRPGDGPFARWMAVVMADVAENYARILGGQLVRIRNPVAGVIHHYQKIGFSLAETYRGATYYERRVP